MLGNQRQRRLNPTLVGFQPGIIETKRLRPVAIEDIQSPTEITLDQKTNRTFQLPEIMNSTSSISRAYKADSMPHTRVSQLYSSFDV